MVCYAGWISQNEYFGGWQPVGETRISPQDAENAEVFRFSSAISAFSAVNNGLVASLPHTASGARHEW